MLSISTEKIELRVSKVEYQENLRKNSIESFLPFFAKLSTMLGRVSFMKLSSENNTWKKKIDLRKTMLAA